MTDEEKKLRKNYLKSMIAYKYLKASDQLDELVSIRDSWDISKAELMISLIKECQTNSQEIVDYYLEYKQLKEELNPDPIPQ